MGRISCRVPICEVSPAKVCDASRHVAAPSCFLGTGSTRRRGLDYSKQRERKREREGASSRMIWRDGQRVVKLEQRFI